LKCVIEITDIGQCTCI